MKKQYRIYDWEHEKFIMVSKKKWKKYQKLKAEMHDIMYEKKNVSSIYLVLTAEGVRKFKTVPAFKQLLWERQLLYLVPGKNFLWVNQTILGKLKQMTSSDPGNMYITIIKPAEV